MNNEVTFEDIMEAARAYVKAFKAHRNAEGVLADAEKRLRQNVCEKPSVIRNAQDFEVMCNWALSNKQLVSHKEGAKSDKARKWDELTDAKKALIKIVPEWVHDVWITVDDIQVQVSGNVVFECITPSN